MSLKKVPILVHGISNNGQAVITNRHFLTRLLFWLALTKLVYLGFIYLAVTAWPNLDEQQYYQVIRHWPMTGDPEVASHFAAWDAAHYLYLSTEGYAAGGYSCAFYPLWPLAVRGFAVLTGGNHLIAGLVLANLLSLAGWILFYRLTARRFGEVVAKWALVFLVTFPGSLFYQFIYSESLFFLLVMLLWAGMERSRYGLAWGAAVLLPLTRGVGLFCVLPIGWHWLMKQRWRWLDRWDWIEAERVRVGSLQSDWVPSLKRREPYGIRPTSSPIGTDAIDGTNGSGSKEGHWVVTLLLGAPVLGWAAYLGLMWVWTDNPFEGVQAQRHWGVHSISNLWNLPKFLLGFLEPTTWHGFRGSLVDRSAFLLLVCSLPLVWRLGKDMMIWTYVLGILPAMSGTFTSYIRFESTVFPLFIGLAVYFSRLKAKWPQWAFLILNVVLQGILVWRFVNFRWAG